MENNAVDFLATFLTHKSVLWMDVMNWIAAGFGKLSHHAVIELAEMRSLSLSK